jgi:hypothetical protein
MFPISKSVRAPRLVDGVQLASGIAAYATVATPF